MACVFGAGLIFIDTIVKKILRRDVRILQNHKFLAGSLGLGSGVMIFSSFYNLLPEAKEHLSSEPSIFKDHADAALMLFFFGGVGTMAIIHFIMHRFNSDAHPTGIENSGTIEQFMQRESNRPHQGSSLLPQHYSYFRSQPQTSTPNGTLGRTTGNNTTTSTSTPGYICNECVQEESEGDDEYEEERYNDSEYVDDEVTSLLNNAFLQIGKTPNSQIGDPSHQHKTDGGQHRDGSDDGESIDIVIGDQQDKILRQAVNMTDDVDLDYDSDDYNHNRSGMRRNSWSTASTHSQKPFAPVSKRRKPGNMPKAKGRKKRTKECTHQHKPAADKNQGSQKLYQMPLGNGINPMTSYGAVPSSSATAPTAGARQYPSQPSASMDPSRHDQATHLRRTSFPRLKGQNTIYSRHDDLDHAIADDREHADLTQIGIQTALTIAVHKFPEGLITFLSTTADPCLGLSVFMAIAVHNLIEGYLIAFPLYIGLHSRVKAFALAAVLGGLSQPLGAVLGWFILRKMASMGWQVSATGAIYAVVAGMMSSIAVNGMWPQAVKCVGRNPTKVVQYSFFAGIAIMGICQAFMGKKCDF
ncbi:hypothetical protein BGX27_011228 [Mortierella sp. AM989]|nr:hypothetical protein BGX27_011228 [Mortierella sp. AM989]